MEERKKFVENYFYIIYFLCITLINYFGFSKICDFAITRIKTAIGLTIGTILIWFHFVRYIFGFVNKISMRVDTYDRGKRKQECSKLFEDYLKKRFIVSDEELFELVKDYIDKEKENDFIFAMNEVFEKKKMCDGAGLEEVVKYFLQSL